MIAHKFYLLLFILGATELKLTHFKINSFSPFRCLFSNYHKIHFFWGGEGLNVTIHCLPSAEVYRFESNKNTPDHV